MSGRMRTWNCQNVNTKKAASRAKNTGGERAETFWPKTMKFRLPGVDKASTVNTGMNAKVISNKTSAKVRQPDLKRSSPIPMNTPMIPKFKFVRPFEASIRISIAAEIPPRIKIHATSLS